ncbi:hypothetical protein DICPUDRAFT_76981 [Dictyostelium purpureum]|uniref:OTU domain-containing protein n=1 Tax=Dictyostelium purpureum TaxID=5786 RepID=F0ZF90_DICPU|nr:uncharacterized protein DICPUDRAFT_76981 [Dictyostelium purpureum]EGC37411.1 hypothetical protein DICPUDRAFT_76981 [Dictyostelium purpureum]|eukprot:XP_003286064.1 hypothetical protein DICPUDRAFT_76981 [Dictyostelium purpureum]
MLALIIAILIFIGCYHLEQYISYRKTKVYDSEIKFAGSYYVLNTTPNKLVPEPLKPIPVPPPQQQQAQQYPYQPLKPQQPPKPQQPQQPKQSPFRFSEATPLSYIFKNEIRNRDYLYKSASSPFFSQTMGHSPQIPTPQCQFQDKWYSSMVKYLPLFGSKGRLSEVEAAQKRLNERLKLYQLKNNKVIPGDGNCQMHSLSDQIYGNLNHSTEIRNAIVQWLRKNKNFLLQNGANLSQFASTNWESYCNNMSRDGTWGDHITLFAAAEIFKANISIISSVDSHQYLIEIEPTTVIANKNILLSHHAELHYGSLSRII